MFIIDLVVIILFVYKIKNVIIIKVNEFWFYNMYWYDFDF